MNYKFYITKIYKSNVKYHLCKQKTNISNFLMQSDLLQFTNVVVENSVYWLIYIYVYIQGYE